VDFSPVNMDYPLSLAASIISNIFVFTFSESSGQAVMISCNSGLILGFFAESVPDSGHLLTVPDS